MKIRVTSDIHGHLIQIKPCDLFIICGDLTPIENHQVNFQRVWLDTDFKYWLRDVPAKCKCFCFGNHDFVSEVYLDEVKKMFKNERNTFLLHESGCEFEGIKIFGLPHTSYFYGWAWNLYEQDLKYKWDLIPQGTDILVTHEPIHGYGDKVMRMITGDNEEKWPEPEHTGSPSLLEKVKEIRPKLCCYGHIHSGFGVYNLEDLTLVNCSLVNEKYQPVNEPKVFEWADGKIITPEALLFDKPKKKRGRKSK
jgi:Icc-related predicted phosphoesterase